MATRRVSQPGQARFDLISRSRFADAALLLIVGISIFAPGQGSAPGPRVAIATAGLLGLLRSRADWRPWLVRGLTFLIGASLIGLQFSAGFYFGDHPTQGWGDTMGGWGFSLLFCGALAWRLQDQIDKRNAQEAEARHQELLLAIRRRK